MLSAIVPTLNAAATLPACLEALREADEIVVIDGGSRDRTFAIAEGWPTRVFGAPQGRGTQLKEGAEAAWGQWLLFVHADTVLAPGWRAAVDRHIAEQPDKAACFRFRLDDSAWQARFMEFGVRQRVRVLGLPYGDQGLLISRKFYDEVGGFRPLPLMEDVDLVDRIGRRRLVTLPVEAVTSAARWRRDGWFRRWGGNILCLTLYRLGVPPRLIARIYR